LVEVTLPISVRFHRLDPGDVEEIHVEINGAPAGLRVFDYAPDTQLATDVADPIKTTVTTRQGSSIDASLGGTLPIPYAELVAHLTPTINAGTSRSKSATETLSRLPPQRAVVVSGTAFEGRGVFFKLKRWSQSSLEGSHELSVTFIAPPKWEGGNLRISCSARGQRMMFWVKQPGMLGRASGDVKLLIQHDTAGSAEMHVE
jgi:hypothetical protein